MFFNNALACFDTVSIIFNTSLANYIKKVPMERQFHRGTSKIIHEAIIS
nr:MAG TPA: hypothetical protein [Caudoviricetes sp.]